MPNATAPNVLLLVADQLRYDCLGSSERFPVKTPHLDRLAREGARFTNAFTPSPVCAPARQALLTGRCADSFGALWNYDFIPTKTPSPCERYWTSQLQVQGYRTAFVGKWHSSLEAGALAFGFDEYIGFDTYQKERIAGRYENISYTGGWFGEANPIPLQDAKDSWAADTVSRLIQTYSRENRPWHIRMDITDPHLPCRPSEPFASMYSPEEIAPWDSFGDRFEDKPYIQRQQIVNWGLEGLDWKDWQPCVARYYGMVSQVDYNIGRILDALDRSGGRDNTLVIFTSDHGDLCGGHGMLDKHYVLYDDVTHVPLIVRYPGRISAGTVVDDFVSNCLDIPPTVEAYCQLDTSRLGVRHGRSLLPLLEDMPDGSSAFADRNFSVSAGNGQQFGLYTQRSIRTHQSKYIWNATDIDEFYDLICDPGEKHNLIRSPQRQEEIAALRRTLYQELKRRDDPFAKTGWLDKTFLEGKKLL